jgi:hypothetical protein
MKFIPSLCTSEIQSAMMVDLHNQNIIPIAFFMRTGSRFTQMQNVAFLSPS